MDLLGAVESCYCGKSLTLVVEQVASTESNTHTEQLQMKPKLVQLLCAALLISVVTNAYLFLEAQMWKTAWVNQLVTTSEVEGILKSSGADISMTAIKKYAERRLGLGSVETVKVDEVHVEFGADKQGLKISTTLILFQDGMYHGSKADLPSR